MNTQPPAGPCRPKVTVLISTFNRPDYLREAVQSVVDQTMTDWELIVMNDGGVDVGHIMADFDDARIRYVHDPVNRKLPYRLNFGLRHARVPSEFRTSLDRRTVKKYVVEWQERLDGEEE